MPRPNPKMTSLTEHLESIRDYVSGLDDLDASNLVFLVSLPHAKTVLSKMEDCQYKETAEAVILMAEILSTLTRSVPGDSDAEA